MVKRIVCSLMVGFILLCCTGCTEQAEEPAEIQAEQELISTVTDPEELAASAETAAFSTTVPDGKRVNIRTYTRYSKLQFEVVNRLTEQTVERNAWMALPDGRVFVQYTFGV